MFRRISACVSVLILLVLAGCEDSGPFGMDGDAEKGPAFELFGGGWAAVLEGPSGEPNEVLNGGFLAAPDFADWTITVDLLAAPPFSFADWSVGEFVAGPFGLPHFESLDASDPPDGVGASVAIFNATTSLTQEVDLSGVAAGSTITLAFQYRFKNFAPIPDPFPTGWQAGVQDFRIEMVPTVGDPAIVFQASTAGLGLFSGGGDDIEAFYVPVTFNASAFVGSVVDLAFVIEAGPPMIVDLDDILIYVVPPAGEDPDPVVDFDGLDITDAKVKIHKKRDRGKSGKERKLKDEFEIKKGHLTLGEDFDGFDLDTEDLTITFGDLEWVIEAGSFVRDDDDDDDDDDGKWKFRGKKPGITHVDIRDDGRFKIKGKGLDLSFIDLKDKDERTVTFTLTIGDDSGDFSIEFDKKGRFKVKKQKKHHDDDDD